MTEGRQSPFGFAVASEAQRAVPSNIYRSDETLSGASGR